MTKRHGPLEGYHPVAVPEWLTGSVDDVLDWVRENWDTYVEMPGFDNLRDEHYADTRKAVFETQIRDTRRACARVRAAAKRICGQGYADVWRELSLDPGDRVYVDRLGLYWTTIRMAKGMATFTRRDVEGEEPEHYRKIDVDVSEKGRVSLHGRVRAYEIDWFITTMTNATFPGEREITVEPDAAILLLSINGKPLDPPIRGSAGLDLVPGELWTRMPGPHWEGPW